MGKQVWKPGNMVYPLPVVMVTVSDGQGTDNIITAAWTGTVCTNPPMVYVSIRPERYSYHMIENTGEFAINLSSESLVYATDFCGVRSGRDCDKFKEMNLTKEKAEKICVPLIKESPINIECKVRKVEKLGSHHMFLADVVAVHADEAYMNEKGKFELNLASPIVYSHGEYYSLKEKVGSFGYSIRKDKGKKVVQKKKQNSFSKKDSQEFKGKQTVNQEEKNYKDWSKGKKKLERKVKSQKDKLRKKDRY